MHSDYRVFDCHCDSVTTGDLLNDNGHLRISDIKKYRGYLQVFAICAEHNYSYTNTIHYIKKYERIMRLKGITPITERKQLDAAFGGILALEGADPLWGKLSALKRFYEKGVRLITLTWNNENDVASSIMALNDRGLTTFGKKLVKECEALGIVVDLSHIGDKGFYDVAEIAKKPFICSHSDSRTVNGKWKRNITDDQFKVLMDCGGVTGINFCTDFLGGSRDLSAVLSHIEHFCSLGGCKNVGIGSDFDGIPNLPHGCDGAGFAVKIAEALLAANYPEATVNAILFDNFRRVFEKCL